MSTTPSNKLRPAGRDDVVDQLRQLMPIRPLGYWEHLIIAERQAGRLHELLGQTGPAADLKWVTELTKVSVVLVPRWKSAGSSGITTFKDGKWVIGVNKGEPHARRRFTLAHEFKHFLDGTRDSVTYKHVEPQRELIANYFAACYLMPKTWLRRSWTRGLQDPEALAGLFGVSEAAMEKRLQYLGFIDREGGRSTASYFRLREMPVDLRSDLPAEAAG